MELSTVVSKNNSYWVNLFRAFVFLFVPIASLNEFGLTLAHAADTSAPVGSISINSGISSTDSGYVYLALAATDAVGVTGYYVSSSSVKPTLTTSGWVNINSSANYSGNTTVSLNSGDGSKTVYVWYKDGAGNISNAFSDSIVLTKNESWKNWYGIAWNGLLSSHAKYAKQMGYEYIALRGYFPSDYQNNPEFAGFKFYDLGPHYRAIRAFNVEIQPGNNTQYIDTKKTYSQAQIDFYNQNMVWKSLLAFPNNMATGSCSSATVCTAMLDFQQQAVIDKVVEKIIVLFHQYEDIDLPFTLAGYMFDETEITGSFWKWDSSLNKEVSVNLYEWTGTDSGFLHSGITHEYLTYADGWAAFLKKLLKRTKEEFPNARWIEEPYRLYRASAYTDEIIFSIKNRADKDELTPDMLVQESSGTEFVDDGNIFNSGVNITKDRVGSSQPNSVGEAENRLYAAKAGINGAWYNWFGRFGGTGNMPRFNEITEVYPRLKLIRLIPGWDNLRRIPLSQRTWNGSITDTVYSSKANIADSNPTSYFDAHVMYSRHWKTGKLFAVFNDATGSIKLNPGETISSIECVDDLFMGNADCMSEFAITDASTGKQLSLKSAVVIPVDASEGQIKGKGYIVTTVANQVDTTAPAAPTGLIIKQ